MCSRDPWQYRQGQHPATSFSPFLGGTEFTTVVPAAGVRRRRSDGDGATAAEVTNPGLRLLSIPELTSGDGTLLERLQHQIEQGSQRVLELFA